MSFTTDAPVEGAPSAPSTTDVGTPTPSAPVTDSFKGASTPSAPTEPAATPAASTDQLYTVKVDGEELQVSLEELTSGYSRTQDYTRKTQTLAEERKALREAAALQAAFDRDPHATLNALAEAFQWTPQQAAAAGAEPQVPFEELDPIEQRLVRAEQFMETQQQQAVRQRIESDFAYVRETYGEFDEDELIAHAIQTGLDIRTAYKDMHFDKVRQQQAANAAAVDAKRAAQVVEGAGTVQPGTVSAPPAEPRNLRDTIRAALRAAS